MSETTMLTDGRGIVVMGMRAADQRDVRDDGTIDLGMCCACGQADPTVRNIMMLPKRAPHPGTGWGCLVCGLPNDGAVAVVCDACLEAKREITEVCSGFPAENRRAHVKSLIEAFDHDMSKH